MGYRGATTDTPKGRRMLAYVESVQGPKFLGPCAWPGCRGAWEQVDHITPRALGGSDENENLQGLCEFHNKAKGDGRAHHFTPRAPAVDDGGGRVSRAWLS